MKSLVVALLLVPAVSAPAGGPSRWLEARSPHFIVISNAGEEKARRLSLEFERVRTMLRRALTTAPLDPRQPVVVLAVDNEDSLRELLPQFWERKGQRPVAAYWGGPHQHCIVLRVDAPAHERFRRVLHEYVHLLTHANLPDLPVWLDEGLSEFWATAAVQDEAVEVGRPAPQDLKALQTRHPWIPLGELLAMERVPDARDKQRLSLFYAQSWALVHYLMLGGASMNLELAPSKNLGDVPRLERALAAYIHGGRFRAVRNEVQSGGEGKPDTTDVRVRELAPAQSLVVRAGCLAEGERADAALPLLTKALAADPGNSTVLETLGYVHFQRNDPPEAARWFDRAIASGSASHLAYFYRAILAGPVPDQVPGRRGVLVDDYLRRAIELDPGFAPAYVRLGDLFAQQPGRSEQALPLMRRAAELEPNNPDYWVDLGRLLARLNRPGEAREAGQRGLAAARSAKSRALVDTFLQDLQAGGPGP